MFWPLASALMRELKQKQIAQKKNAKRRAVLQQLNKERHLQTTTQNEE